MTPLDIARAAERAANACGGCGKNGFLAEIGAPGALDAAAAHVRAHPDAPAEALFLALTREPVTWRELMARKRVAVEIFRASLLVMDRLAAADAVEAEARRPRAPAPLPPADNPLTETTAGAWERWSDE
jgi:hypothetical protein